MIKFIDLILNKLFKYRQSVGLSLFFFGGPLIYFLRDGIKLAPGSTAFTGAFTMGSLLIAIPFNLKKVYQTNTIGYLMCIGYTILAVFYLAVYTPNRGWFTNTTVEAVYQGIIILSMFIFAGTSINSLKDNFLQITLIICVIGGLGLLYYIFKNPMYVIGMRASISFSGDDAMSSMGNPHIYAKSAYCGLVAGVILLREEKRILYRLIYLGCVFLLLVVLALCQAMAMILVTGIFFFLYYISSFNSNNIYKSLKWLTGLKGFALLALTALLVYYVVEHTRFSEFFGHISGLITERVEKIFMTLTGTEPSTPTIVAGDDSASTRVTNITAMFKDMNERIEDGDWLSVILGQGYQHKYIDSPFFQTLNDLGIIGFSFFAIIHLVLLAWVGRQVINPTCGFTLFVAYTFLATVIQNFTFGMPYDYQRWTVMLFVARFALDYKKVVVTKPAGSTVSA
ncbi:hypothetical protein [Emticicia fluvialis]|uniref:hypothetical protein n=1 Tax=Emticicia fluvialis TaxID=2974474 RepID=UPI0021664E3D|nr:hypothetical protein [Emticicia fluvialis]